MERQRRADVDFGWEIELWISVLLLVAGHHSHVSLRLPDPCLCSDEPGAKAYVEAVPTLVEKDPVWFWMILFNYCKHWLKLTGVIVQKERKKRFEAVYFFWLSWILQRSFFFHFSLLTSAAPDTQVFSSLSPWGRSSRLWCPHSLKQVDRHRHE